MNGKGFGRKRSWPDHGTIICLDELEETTINIRQCSGRDSNRAFKSRALPLRQPAQLARRHNPEDHNMNLHHRENSLVLWLPLWSRVKLVKYLLQLEDRLPSSAEGVVRSLLVVFRCRGAALDLLLQGERMLGAVNLSEGRTGYRSIL
jgi:hypothetical protein